MISTGTTALDITLAQMNPPREDQPAACPKRWDDAGVEATLFPQSAPPASERAPARSKPDFVWIHEQLRQHRHLTLQLLWEEYRQANPHTYRYSRFFELYQRWRSKLDVVLRQEHRAGEKMFVDWAGSTIPVYDRHTGHAWQSPLFVATLGASSYAWAEATRDQQMESWLSAHAHAFRALWRHYRPRGFR